MSKYKVKGEVDYLDPINSYVIDVVDELSKMLSEELAKEIAKEIDKDILRNLGFEPDRNKRRKNSIKKIYGL